MFKQTFPTNIVMKSVWLLLSRRAHSFNSFILIRLYRAPQNDVLESVLQLEKLIIEAKKSNNRTVIYGDWNLSFLTQKVQMSK